jgi:uncharacterized membrane protein
MGKKRSPGKPPSPVVHEIPPSFQLTQQEANEQTEVEKLGFERLVFFSDAVFAIAITVLVLEIHLPENGESMDNAQLFKALLGLFPQYLAYVISFLVIGSLWMNHHRKFRLIQGYDRQVLLLNLIFLMAIAFIPFPTMVLSRSGNRTATIFYALTIIAAGGISLLITLYTKAHPSLLAPQANPVAMRRQVWRGLVMPGVFLFSIGLAYINEDVAKFSWILIIPVIAFLHRFD